MEDIWGMQNSGRQNTYRETSFCFEKLISPQLISDNLFGGTTPKPDRPGMGTFYAYVPYVFSMRFYVLT